MLLFELPDLLHPGDPKSSFTFSLSSLQLWLLILLWIVPLVWWQHTHLNQEWRGKKKSGENPAENPLTPHPVDKSAWEAAHSPSSPTLAPSKERPDTLQRVTRRRDPTWIPQIYIINKYYHKYHNVSVHATDHLADSKRPGVISLFLLLSL